jgi:hypothetical protein
LRRLNVSPKKVPCKTISLRRLNVSPKKVPWKTISLRSLNVSPKKVPWKTISLRRLNVSPKKVPWKTISLAGNGLSFGKRRLNDNLLAKFSKEKGTWNVSNVWDKISKDKIYPNQEFCIYLKLLKPKC